MILRRSKAQFFAICAIRWLSSAFAQSDVFAQGLSALETRLAALEQRRAKTATSKIAALTERVVALEAQLSECCQGADGSCRASAAHPAQPPASPEVMPAKQEPPKSHPRSSTSTPSKPYILEDNSLAGPNPFPREVLPIDPKFKEYMEPLPSPRPSGDVEVRLALIVLWFGRLPEYTPHFLASLWPAHKLGVEVWIFLTSAPGEDPVVEECRKLDFAHAKIQYIEKRELAKRVLTALELVDEVNNEYRLGNVSKNLNGAKGNDVKPLYGALFKEELQNFTHWGWTDIDVIFGDMSPIMSDITKYDVVAYPDALLDAIYFSGQLTVFRNMDYFHRFFLLRYQTYIGEDNTRTASMWYAYLMAEQGNRLWDEKYSLWFALRHPSVTMLVDFSRQPATKCQHSARMKRVVSMADGRLFLMGNTHKDNDEALAFAPGDWTVSDWQEGVDEFKDEHDCVPWFHKHWTWRCLPKRITEGIVYTWDGKKLAVVDIDPMRAKCNNREIAFYHMHKSKINASLVMEPIKFGHESWYLEVLITPRTMTFAPAGSDRVPQTIPTQQRGSTRPPWTTAVVTDSQPEPRNSGPVSERIPRIVHFILSDEGTSFFDWTRWLAVAAAHRHLDAQIKLHVLGDLPSVHPGWFERVKSIPNVTVVRFGRADVPTQLNGRDVIEPAHLADFRRMDVLFEEGGMYLDLDAIALRSWDDLLIHPCVVGRQFTGEVAVGTILAEPHNPEIGELRRRMRANFTGGWAKHSIDTFAHYFQTASTKCVILPHAGFFPFSWNHTGLQSLFDEDGFDWSASKAMHLYHSQSEGHVRYFNPRYRKREGKLPSNFANGVELGIGTEAFVKLEKELDDMPVFTSEVSKAVKEKKELLKQKMQSQTSDKTATLQQKPEGEDGKKEDAPDEAFQECMDIERKAQGADEYDPSEWNFTESEKGDGDVRNADREKAFEYIYATNAWNGGSGPGSRVIATAGARCALEMAHKQYRLRSLFDISGDFRWMRLWLEKHPEIRYHGGDIVAKLAKGLESKYGRSASSGKAAWSFAQIDLVCSDDLPLKLPGVDLVFLREVLQHNSPQEILQILKCVSGSGAKWLMTSNFKDFQIEVGNRTVTLRSKNLDESSSVEHLDKWRWHAHDLTKPPYSLGVPEKIFPDNGKVLALWRLPLNL